MRFASLLEDNRLRLAISAIGLAFLGVLFLQLLIDMSNQAFWRHDALTYLDSYRMKLTSEGRWVNYFFFPVLKATPPLLAWYIFVFVWLAFLTILFADLSKSWIFGALCGLAVVMNGGFGSQAFWPSTMLLLPFILLATYLLVRTKLRYSVFAASSILLFGTISSAVFILPVLWWRQIRCWSFLKHVGMGLFWLFIFVLGTGVAFLSVKLIAGETLSPARWRYFNKPENTADILQNLLHIWRIFNTQINVLFPKFYMVMMALIGAVSWLVLINTNDKNSPAQAGAQLLKCLIWAFCMLVAIYLQAGLLGMHVSYRTAWIGLLGILMLAAYGMSQPKANAIPVAVIVAVICLTGFTGQSQIRETHQKFEEVHRLTSEIKAELEKANQVDFSTFRQIVVLGEEGSGKWPIDQLSKVKLGNTGHGEGLNRGSVRWARSFQETPAQKVHVCIIDDGASKGFCYNRLPEEERLNNWPCGGVHLGFCRNVKTNKDAIILRLPRPGEATE
jgi:hypothetical protein